MDLIIPDTSSGLPAQVGAFTTTRTGGVSHAPYDDGAGGGGLNLGSHVGDRWHDVLQNRALLRRLLPSDPVWLSQIHGATAVDAACVRGVPEADASITNQRGVVCAILTADCLPVLLWDAAGRVVGAAHAGWRGLAAGVLESTVDGMRRAGAGQLGVWLGPAIGSRRFEVGELVPQAFADHLAETSSAFEPLPGQPGKYLVDIYRLARIILTQAGVDRISGGEFCTVSDQRRFFSYRRDQATGRMASLIWIR